MTVPAGFSTPTPDPAEAAFIWRVLEQFAFDACDHLFFRVDDGHMSIGVNCSDTFAWGCADFEEITPANLDILIAARKDVTDIDRLAWEWPLLFCARVRAMRPQGAVYKSIKPTLHHLFDECGPSREAGLGNPVARP